MKSSTTTFPNLRLGLAVAAFSRLSSRFAVLLTIVSFAVCGYGSDLVQFKNAFRTDVKSFGVGGMRNVGSGTITVSGVGTGTVKSAYLYWHGPTNVTDPAVNATVTFNGHTITGTNIGFSSDNCWGFINSQAYRADVTQFVSGDGSYLLTGFGSAPNTTTGGANTNGASLIVFYDDGNPANDRDVVLFNGNDSNINNIYDANGWNATLGGINYSTGTVNMQLHVADGQTLTDDALRINGNVLVDIGPIFQGDSVPSANNGPANNGSLWDIKSFDVTSFLTVGPNTLALTTGVNSDCLALVVAAFDLPSGAAPNTQTQLITGGSQTFTFSNNGTDATFQPNIPAAFVTPNTDMTVEQDQITQDQLTALLGGGPIITSSTLLTASTTTGQFANSKIVPVRGTTNDANGLLFKVSCSDHITHLPKACPSDPQLLKRILVKHSYKSGNGTLPVNPAFLEMNDVGGICDGSTAHDTLIDFDPSDPVPTGATDGFSCWVFVDKTAVQAADFDDPLVAVSVRRKAFSTAGLATSGTGSNGIAPQTENVLFQVGSYSAFIPKNSFKKVFTGYVYTGTILGVKLVVGILPLAGRKYAFSITGFGTNLGHTGMPTAVPVELTIGNDAGKKPSVHVLFVP
jgi:hypothetical protein